MRNLRVTLCVVLASALLAATHAPRSQANSRAQQPARAKQSVEAKQPADAKAERAQYSITLNLDFDARTYAGRERVRWINRDDRPASAVYFHLYPNMRAEDERAGAQAPPDSSAPVEPRLEVTEARVAASAQTLFFALEDDGATMRLQLREAVPAGGAVEIELSFKGTVPEIDADETSLSAHVVQQVGAALRDTREVRRARDTNFVSRGVMLLGSFFPVLAARAGGDWQRRVEPSVGDSFFADVADYQLTVNTLGEIALFTSGEESGNLETSRNSSRAFKGESMRGFALVAGRGLRSEEREVGGVRVRSVFTAEHEKVGRRVLAFAADAARVYTLRFGALPLKTVTVAESPLVAGFGSADFAGLAVIASAFYVDFDSPTMRSMPELVREQRASVEDSLEFAAAQGVAQQWWGEAVGSDPAREPVLDEALAQWSALLYVQDTHGEERAGAVRDDQMRGVYQVYRTFGGEDRAADSPSREFRNSFQYAAIVASKGALMFVALRQLLGEEKFFKALRSYYEANRLEVAELDDLRAAFVAEAELLQRRMVTRTFNRWLNEKRGDEDIAPPNPQLAAALGIATEQQQQNGKDRNAFSRLGRFFWRQMTRIR
ncbi:MAG TPA: M1 family aminopeptidase [Pyrinomonadaceae bacterium]|nr:M1 family aminopeptidase [Pyrinomonadaceae bacterium]